MSTGQKGNGSETTEPRLSKRAQNLAQRIMEIERQNGGRGRIQIDLLMVDGGWWFNVIQPGKLERIGE